MPDGPPLKPAAKSARETLRGAAAAPKRRADSRAETARSVGLGAETAALLRSCAEELALSPEPLRAARLHLEIARAHESAGGLAEAARHYERAVSGAPDHLAAIRGLRRVQLARGRYQGAISLFDVEARLLADAKRRARLYYDKGRLLEDRLGNPERAREAYLRALELDPQNASVLKAVEQLQMREGRTGELSDTYERAANAIVEDEFHRAALITRRARLLETGGDLAAAAELYETALSLDPAGLGALEALEQLYKRSGEWRRLIDALERLALQSEDARLTALAYYRVARVHSERLGNREEAIRALAQAARAAPDDSLILEDLARLYEDSEMFVSLANTLGALVATAAEKGEQVSLLHSIGVIQELLGREEEAILSLRAAIEVDPTQIPVLQALGKLYTRRGEWMELIAMHQAEAGATPDPQRAAAAHARIAELFEVKLGEPAEAAEHHNRALALVPGHAASFKALDRLYNRAGEYRKLVELHERALDRDLDPKRRVAHLFKIGALWEDRLEDPTQAAHAYRRILEIEPEEIGALQALQRVSERAERWADLVEALEREVELAADHDLAIALLHRAGTVLDEHLGDRGAALRRFRRILELRPTFVPALASAGRIYYRSGRWEDLLEMYGAELEVTQRGTASAALLHKMGEVCETRLGQDDRATDLYRRASGEDPGYRPALRALARLLRERRDWRGLVDVLAMELEALATPRARAATLYRAGEVYEEHLDDPERAIHCHEQALACFERFPPSAAALARLRAARGDWPAVAEELGRQAHETSDRARVASALLQRAELYRDRLDDPERAIEYYEAVLSHDRARLPALLALESLYPRVGAWTKLAEVYRRESELYSDPGARLAALRELARLLEVRELGDRDQHIAVYRQIISLEPGDEVALAALARIAQETADDELLIEILRRMAHTAGDATDAATHYARIGMTLERAGDRRALEAYENALRRDPENLAAIRGFSRLADLLGDANAMAEAARLEAAVTRAPEAVAQHLVQSAILRLERLDDPEGAILDLERALESNPDDEHAAEWLAPPMLSSGRKQRLLDTLSRAAGSAKRKERKTALWLRVADLQAEVFGDRGAAIAAARRAVTASPRHVAALRALASLLQANQQWHDAIASLEEAISLTDDLGIVCEAQLELAEILDQKIEDPKAAVARIEKVLELEPSHPGALRRLLDHQVRAGDRAAAADTARRLADASPDQVGRADALTQAARIEQQRGDTAAAEEALAKALSAEGPGGAAARQFEKMAVETGSWVGYAAALANHIKQARARVAGSAAAALAPAYLELAAVYAERMKLPNKGLETLEDGIHATGGDRSLVADLVRRLGAEGRLADAEARLHRLLSASPAHLYLWEQLVRILEQAGRPAEAILARDPLAFLGGPAGGGPTRTPRPAGAAPNSLGPETLRAIAFDQPWASPAADLLAAITEAVGKIHPPELGHLGLSRRDRIGAGADHPVRALLDRLADAFGLEVDLYEHFQNTPLVAVEMTEPPSVLVGSRLRGLPPAQQVFLLGRPIAAAAGRFHAAEGLTPLELGLLLGAATRAVIPDFMAPGADEEALETLSQRLKKAVPRRARRALEIAASEYAATPLADPRAWQRALAQTARRAALLLCDDLHAAVEAMRRSEGLGELAGPALFEASPDIADLLLFWVSEPAMQVRRRAALL